MAKFAKGASGRKPSWMFVYGDRPDDSLLVMAEALAAGNNPFETKTPKMTTTAGVSYRRQIYGWVKQEERRLFESTSAAKVMRGPSAKSNPHVYEISSGIRGGGPVWSKRSLGGVEAHIYPKLTCGEKRPSRIEPISEPLIRVAPVPSRSRSLPVGNQMSAAIATPAVELRNARNLVRTAMSPSPLALPLAWKGAAVVASALSN